MMRKDLARLLLVLLLLAVGCVPSTTTPPQPLTLPAALFDAEVENHHVTLVLHTACEELRPPEGVSKVEHCFHADIHVAKSGRLEVNIILLDLSEGYQKGTPIQPEKAMGGGGTGSGWVEPGAYEINLPFRPMEDSAPVAVFLEIQTRTDEGQARSSQRLGPVVLQLLPDAQGIARLDQ